MEKLTKKAEEIMIERFGKDNVIALATTENGIPYVRSVNAFYEDKAFYIITYELSNKMKQIEKIRMLRSQESGLPHMGEGSTWGVLVNMRMQK